MEEAEEVAADVRAELWVLYGCEGGGEPEGGAVARDVHEGVWGGWVVPGECEGGGAPAVDDAVDADVQVGLGAPGAVPGVRA